jgi:hypothetical protein
MSRPLDLRKQQLWLRHMQRSQLTIRDFCAHRQLRQPNFYFWRRLLRERGLLTPAGSATAVAATADAGLTTPLFVVATLEDAQATPQPIEIVLPNGLAARVAAGFDAATLASGSLSADDLSLLLHHRWTPPSSS